MLSRLPPAAAADAPAVWWDLLAPSTAERQQVESALGIGLPSAEVMREIEASGRLYQIDGAAVMTALVPRGTGEEDDDTTLTFVLAGHQLATLRPTDVSAVRILFERLARQSASLPSPASILVRLLEAIVDGLADRLEQVGADLSQISQRVFRHRRLQARAVPDYQVVLRQLGHDGDQLSLVTESLFSIERLVTFASRLNDIRAAETLGRRVKTLRRDVSSLSDHAGLLNGKLTFLLDATLGMIGISQNNIIKGLSVAAAVFLPPTLIASIYGMNFEYMPLLGKPWGYPAALGVMLATAIAPYWVFKRLRWF